MGKKDNTKRDQAVCDNMTVTLGRSCNNLNNSVKNSCKLGSKTNVKKQNILLQKNYARYLYEIVRDLAESRPNTSVPIKKTMQL